ncbi:uncharacterized protein LOC120337330 isoform X1 [Styela clava]
MSDIIPCSFSTLRFKTKARSKSCCVEKTPWSGDELLVFDNLWESNMSSSMNSLASFAKDRPRKNSFVASCGIVTMSCQTSTYQTRAKKGKNTQGLNYDEVICSDSEDEENVNKCEIVMAIAICYDRCDGIMDSAMLIRLVDVEDSLQWKPRRIADHEILHAQLSHVVHEIYAWYVADSAEHYVIGFKDLKGSKYYYAAIGEDGLLRLASDFDPPYTLNRSDMSEDPRVIRYHKNEHSGRHFLQSVKYAGHFINVTNGYLKAEESKERNSTSWLLRPL